MKYILDDSTITCGDFMLGHAACLYHRIHTLISVDLMFVSQNTYTYKC